MPIIRVPFITREFVRANPDKLFLFGDNELRTGMGGQARHMRGEPNAHGIRTKFAPHSRPDAFWSDKDFDANCDMISLDLVVPELWLVANKDVIIPQHDLGTGRARLNELAPETFKYLQNRIAGLARYNYSK